MTTVSKVSMLSAGVAIAAFMTAGIALAQSSPITVTADEPSSLTANSRGAAVATVTLSANQSGSFQVRSLPLSLSLTNGAQASSLTNCQAYNENDGGSSVTTGANSLIALQEGTNTLTFNSPITVNSGTPVTLTLRCDVSGIVAPGTQFQFAPGTAALVSDTNDDQDDQNGQGTGSQSARLAANLVVVPRVVPGTQDTAIALVQLYASGTNDAIRVTRIPLTVSYTGPAQLTGCQVRDLTNLTSPLTTGSNVVTTLGNGANTFVLDTPRTIAGSGSATLVVTCDAASSALLGSTIGLSINPSSIQAAANSNGTAIVPVAGGPNNTTGVTTGVMTFAATQTGDLGGGGQIPAVPGLPNTGAGGMGGAFALAIMGLAVVLGLGYLYSRRYS